MPASVAKPVIPTLSNLRLVRYATGWGHTPADYAKAMAEGDPVPLKVTTHPTTGESFVSVYRTTLTMPSSSKRANEPDSVEVVVKVNPLPTLGKRLQALLRRTKHHRQWRGYERLVTAKIDAAEPLAILHARAHNSAAEVLVLAHAEGKTLLELFAAHADGCPLPEGIIPQLAITIGTFEDRRLFNRDPKPSNIVVDEGLHGSCRCTLIDTVGVVRKGSRAHDFLRHFLRLLLLETRGTGIACPPHFTMDLAAGVIAGPMPKPPAGARAEEVEKAQAQARELLDSVERSVVDRDPTPADNPLPPTS